MKIAAILQTLGGSTCALFGLWIVKPEWFGTYYDVDLYAVYQSVENAKEDTTAKTQNAITTSNDKKMECKSTQTKTHDCDIFYSSTITETNKDINADSFKERLDTIDEKNNKTYYKITVTKKLVKELKTSKTIEIQKKGSSSSDKKFILKILLLKENNWYKSLDKTLIPETDQYYIVQAEKLNETTQEIEKGSGKFGCWYYKIKNIEDCEIKSLTNNVEGISDMGNIQFQNTDVSKIKDKNFYLIKVKDWYSSLFVKVTGDSSNTGTTQQDKWMKINVKEQAFIYNSNTLIHGKNS